MGLLQGIDADKIITPETNFWEMISTDISLVCALMRVTCGYWVICGDWSVVFLLQKCPVSWVKPILPGQGLHTAQIFAFWWLCVALPPSFPLSLPVSAHMLHPSPWRLCSLWIHGCPSSVHLWRGAGTGVTPLAAAWDVQAQDRMISGQTPATFYVLTVNSSRLLPVLQSLHVPALESVIKRSLCRSPVWSKVMEGWFSQYCYKKKTADKGCISKPL